MAQDAPAAAKDQLPKVEDVVKDMQTVEGLITLYFHAPDDATKDTSRLLARIPRSLLDKDLMLATSISRGEAMGFPVGTDLVRFRVSGNRVFLIAPDTSVKEGGNRPIGEAVEATYTPRFLGVFPLLARSAGGDVVIDLGGFLQASASQWAGPRAGQVVVRYPKVKSFPDNALIDVDMITASPRGSSSVGVGFSFRRLPDLQGNPYKPRLADERVGYFTTIRQDWNAAYDSRETLVRYINRWNLQKKDPTLEMSPPVKPIVFIVEKTVPLQWRRFVRDGILEWNKAYEAIGITGAIEVQQQTDDNEFANVDPEDARYNFFRWIVTGRGFAMGPSRPDPRTGEILDADIIMDDAMVRYYFQDYRNLLGPAAMATMHGPEWIEFWEKNPGFIPQGMTLDEVKQAATEMRLDASVAAERPGELLVDAGPTEGWPIAGARKLRDLYDAAGCSYAVGMRMKMSKLFLMASAQPAAGGPRKIPERLIGEMIKNVASHEVGHTLGLRHNFIASTWLTPEEIKTRRDAGGEALFASVMDYDAALTFPGDRIENIKHITSPVIGPYDFWAIEYGYTAAEDAAAKAASRNTEPGLAYSTDEDVAGPSSPDPRSNRWDMSSDPIVWAENQIALSNELLKDFDTWAVDKDEPNHFLRQAFVSLMFEKTRPLSYVARLVGGQEFTRNRAGDVNAKAPLTLVSPERQRKAMNLLGRTIFNDEFLAVEASLLNRLPASRDEGTSWPGPRIDFPVHATMLSLQNSSLAHLINPMVLQRVYDAELKSTDNDKFTAAELLKSTIEVIWGNPRSIRGGNDAKPAVSSVRRNLQQAHVGGLLAIARTRPGQTVSADLHAMVRFVLRDLADGLGESLKGNVDLATKAHLSETRSLIERTLDADEVQVQMSMPNVVFLNQPPTSRE
jgi:hypothetical protein